MKPFLYIFFFLSLLSGCTNDNSEVVPTIFSKEEVKVIKNLMDDFEHLMLEMYQSVYPNQNNSQNPDLFEASLNHLALEILVTRFCSDDKRYYDIIDKLKKLFEKYEQTNLAQSIWDIHESPFTDKLKENYKSVHPSLMDKIDNADHLYFVSFKENSNYTKFLKVKSENNRHYADYYDTVARFMSVAPALEAGFPRNIWRYDTNSFDDRFLLTIHFLSIGEKWE